MKYKIFEDFRYHNENGKPYEGGPKLVYKIRRLREGGVTLSPSGDEINMRDPFYDDYYHNGKLFYEAESDAVKVLRTL